MLQALEKIAREAGDAIMAAYQREVTVVQKADDSPLTEADLAAHQIIVRGLTALTASIPVLSEEAANIDWSVRRHWPRFWLVDPLDGTKEFIKHNGEFTVNIALIEEGRPVMAVVYAPALDKLYMAEGGQAWRVVQGVREPLQVQQAMPPVVVASRSHQDPRLASYLAELGPHQLTSVGSSLKFCLVAEGQAQLYPRFGRTIAWDTAAGHCIAEAAGAVVETLDNQPLRYNQQEDLANPPFIVRVAWARGCC
ncbi:MAG: 3'(2'),5'-bisphosphate nucleotidase CysQ [Plesiomonas shigelloides]